MLGRFDRAEWSRRSELTGEPHYNIPLLRREGWTDRHLMILDLSSTGVAGTFLPMKGGNSKLDTEEAGIGHIV